MAPILSLVAFADFGTHGVLVGTSRKWTHDNRPGRRMARSCPDMRIRLELDIRFPALEIASGEMFCESTL